MAANRGMTSLKRKRRNENSMREYDRLPAELRAWLASAALPWRPRSVRRAFERAVARTTDRVRALEELDRLQSRLVARDAHKVWGNDHPGASVRGLRPEVPQGTSTTKLPSFDTPVSAKAVARHTPD